ncbi:MAG: sulfite exporter TauE/SafE family protein, partial [Ilumatobacteraceae bacterium]
PDSWTTGQPLVFCVLVLASPGVHPFWLRRGAQGRADPSSSPPPQRHVSRRGLVGMGIAGGLVPSPSALVILLSAIALGRTWFGILLVTGYGVGMAGTLTAAGVLLVKVRDRYQHRMQSKSGRVRNAARRWGLIAPYFTASLVLIVGVGLALRSLGSI